MVFFFFSLALDKTLKSEELEFRCMFKNLGPYNISTSLLPFISYNINYQSGHRIVDNIIFIVDASRPRSESNAVHVGQNWLRR